MDKAAIDFKRLRAMLEQARGEDGRLEAVGRKAVVVEIERARRAGTSYPEIATALGVPFQTLMTWRYFVQGRRKKRLERVRVRELSRGDSEARAFVVHGPSGMRVELASVADVAALWRALL